MRLHGDEGDVIIYTPDYSGGTRKRIFRRPIPLTYLSSDITNCSSEIMALWATFVLIVTRASDELMALTFAAGKPTTQIQRVASSVLAKVAIDDRTSKTFQGNYNLIIAGRVCKWLIENKHEAWDFSAGTINDNAFASILYKETTNTVCF